MARSFARARKVKEPLAPVVYEVSGEIETVMHRLVRFNPVQFGWTNNFKLGCVIVRGSRPKEEGGCVILARFVKVPPLWHGLTGYDAIIRVEGWAWARLDAASQEALVAHELCHGSMSDKGALRVVKHDLEEFGFVVRKYGAWQENIALFDRQLALFEPSLGTAASAEVEQTVVPFTRERRPRREAKTQPAAEEELDEELGEPESVEDVASRIRDVLEDRGSADLGACPWPGCELAEDHPGQHQTAADDRPEGEEA